VLFGLTRPFEESAELFDGMGIHDERRSAPVEYET